QVEADVELGAAVVEGRESALIFAKLLRVRLMRAGEAADQHWQDDERRRQRQSDGEEQEDRQISGGNAGQRRTPEGLQGWRRFRTLGLSGQAPQTVRIILKNVQRTHTP